MRTICSEVNCIKVAVRKGRCLRHRIEPPVKTKLADDAFYDSKKWKSLRTYILSNEPLCRQCIMFGAVTPAVAVDHIVEIKDGGSKFDEDNLQALCHGCHSRKTAIQRKIRNRG